MNAHTSIMQLLCSFGLIYSRIETRYVPNRNEQGVYISYGLRMMLDSFFSTSILRSRLTTFRPHPPSLGLLQNLNI